MSDKLATVYVGMEKVVLSLLIGPTLLRGSLKVTSLNLIGLMFQRDTIMDLDTSQ